MGPGFDAFAIALALHMELEVIETPGTFAIETDLRIARDKRNLVVRGFEKLHSAEGFTFRISSEIPLSGGLGTSAAAYVAGPSILESSPVVREVTDRLAESVQRLEIGNL